MVLRSGYTFTVINCLDNKSLLFWGKLAYGNTRAIKGSICVLHPLFVLQREWRLVFSRLGGVRFYTNRNGRHPMIAP